VIALKKVVCFLVIVVLISAGSGCAINNTSGLLADKSGHVVWPDGQLKKKFMDYWGYRSSGDDINALKLEAPYVKEMVVLEKYADFITAGKKRRWNAVRIDKIEWLNQNLVMIGFTAEIKEAASSRMMEVYFSDRWILMNEKWYHAFDDPIINPDK
jgi:hypothetical protein